MMMMMMVMGVVNAGTGVDGQFAEPRCSKRVWLGSRQAHSNTVEMDEYPYTIREESRPN